MTAVDRMMDALKKAGAIGDFREVAEEWIRSTAVELTGAQDDRYLHALRGRMQICIELADAAARAQGLVDAEAKASAMDLIPGADL